MAKRFNPDTEVVEIEVEPIEPRDFTLTHESNYDDGLTLWSSAVTDITALYERALQFGVPADADSACQVKKLARRWLEGWTDQEYQTNRAEHRRRWS